MARKPVSTFDDQKNAKERRRMIEELNELLRASLLIGGEIKTAQVGVIAVIEGGYLTGFQTVNTQGKPAEHLLSTMTN